MHDNGEPYPLAVNREYMAAYVVPREVQDAKEVARELSIILGKDESEILLKLSDTRELLG